MTEYLSFGKSERVAILAVILMIVIVVMLPAVIKRIHKPVNVSDQLFEELIAEFLKKEEVTGVAQQTGFDFTNPDRESVRQKMVLFQFDPNTLSESGWARMGFSAKQAKGIIKYREKGGRFRKKEDLKKLYAVSDEVYILIEPYIMITDRKPESDRTFTERSKFDIQPGIVPERYQAELNSADSAELVKVYGIGPATAKRIIRYRERLGGYVNREQLREVAGVDSSRYEMIKEGVFADPDVVRKIDINKSSISQLREHPYIDYYIAKAIVDNRIKKGAYSSPDELREIPLIYDALYQKLRPYISISD
ncbi:MAG: helix-hairpin-helix domain-containing protein [Bacteroidota bacterium]